MSEQGYEQLTLFQAGSHASRFPLPGSDEARKMTVTSGRRCAELYANFSPLGYLVRMCLGSSIWHSTRCWLTWKISATPRNRLLFQLAVSMPHTDATGSQFWHTPKASDADMGMTAKTRGRPIEKSTHLQTQVYCVERGLIPTPRASDHNQAPLNRYYSPERERERDGGYRAQLCELVEVTPRGRIGLLNPMWVEWLMGFPTGWTELDASETP